MESDDQNLSEPSRLSTREFARRAALAVFIAVVVTGLAVFVAFSIETWFAAYLGILLAIFIRALGGWTARLTRLPEPFSILTALILLIAFFAFVGWLLTKPLTVETQELQQRLPRAFDHLRQQIQTAGLDRFVPDHLPGGNEIAGATGSFISKALGIFSGTMQSLLTALVVIFLGVYLAFAPAQYVTGIVSLFPAAKRARVRGILKETSIKLRHWILGQIVSMLAVGGLIALGLYLVSVPVPLVLGVLAAVLDIVPFFGPIIGSVPAILLGFSVSPLHALYAVLIFIAANQIESHLLLPLIQRYSIRLPPALTVFTLLLLGSLFGFWGILLAVPLTATTLLLVKRIYVEDVLDGAAGSEKQRRN